MNAAPKKLILIVEGKGDAMALPGLVTRYYQERDYYHICVGGEPLISNGCGKLKVQSSKESKKHGGHSSGIEHYVEKAVKNKGADAILVVLDADAECTRNKKPGLGPGLLRRAEDAAEGKPVAVVVACREYESWLVSGWKGIAEAIQTDPKSPFPDFNPQAISEQDQQNAESLTGYERKLGTALGEPYVKTGSQRALTRYLTLTGHGAPCGRSYKKLVKELERLATALRTN